MKVDAARKKRVLVFPCGTEIALEIHRSLCCCSHVEVFGVNSIEPNPGSYAFKNYLALLPAVHAPRFMDELIDCIRQNQIDFIYPAHDDVALALADQDERLGCGVIGSPRATCEICRSKSTTYERLAGCTAMPRLYTPGISMNMHFPIFVKPDRGQGSKGARIIHSRQEWEFALEQDPALISMEYLPGTEYTVDCFTDFSGRLRFAGPRERICIANGISTHTRAIQDKALVEIAHTINQSLIFRGAWFFQMKRNDREELVLLEAAPRVSGGMGVFRGLGVNLPLLSVYDRAGLAVDVVPQQFSIEMNRSLNVNFDIGIDYEYVYVDLDDTLIRNHQVDSLLIAFLYQCRNKGKQIYLLTRHAGDVDETLKRHALTEIFTEILCIDAVKPKSAVIQNKNAIFIDDSFAERMEVHQKNAIPVFAPDVIDGLMDWRR